MKEFNDEEIRNILSDYKLKNPGGSLFAQTIALAQKEFVRVAYPEAEKERWIFGILLFAGIMTVCMFYVLTVGSIIWFSSNGFAENLVKQAILAMSAASGSMIAGAVIITASKLISKSRQNIRLCAERRYGGGL